MSTDNTPAAQKRQANNGYSLDRARYIRDHLPDISLAERGVLNDANTRANRKGEFFVRHKVWAKALGVNPSTLRYQLKKLREDGYIDWTLRGPSCATYTVLPNGVSAENSATISAENLAPKSAENSATEDTSTKTPLKKTNPTGGADAPQSDSEIFSQENEKEKGAASAGITLVQLISRIEKANAIAAKFTTAGTDHEARWGLICEMTKAFHPQIVPLIGLQHFQMLIRPLDRYAKKLAKENSSDLVPAAIGHLFALGRGFPEPMKDILGQPDDFAAKLAACVAQIVEADDSDDDVTKYTVKIDPLLKYGVSIKEEAQ